ncbi:MAG TPA: arginine repressor [Candidatus Limnocylindria bacterium]|nr:arginine repressor [Candidatus Limnocylindria bacterium]
MEVMKRLRQQQIREIVQQRPIRTQHELAAALSQRGVHATQATISRDIAELGLVKANRAGARVYALPARMDGAAELSADERLAALLRDLPVELRVAGQLVVLRAVPGSAHAMAAALDRARWPEVAGSIAGDDTVFIACADRSAAVRVLKRLEALAGSG